MLVITNVSDVRRVYGNSSFCQSSGGKCLPLVNDIKGLDHVFSV